MYMPRILEGRRRLPTLVVGEAWSLGYVHQGSDHHVDGDHGHVVALMRWPSRFGPPSKVEHFYRYAFVTRKQVYESVAEWIKVFYNRTRIHTSINGYLPVEYELKTTAPLLEVA